MDQMSTCELIDNARFNLMNYKKTRIENFIDLAIEQLETASKQAEAEEDA